MLLKKIYNKITAKRQHEKDLWFYVKMYDMESEVKYCMEYQNMSLEEAMMEWDIHPYDLTKTNNYVFCNKCKTLRRKDC